MSRLDNAVAALGRAPEKPPSPRRYAHPPPRGAPLWPVWVSIGVLAVAVLLVAIF